MREIVKKQLTKVKNHYQALSEYKRYIDQLGFDFSVDSFEKLSIEQKAILEAYLKRFASLQDYLGAKVFKSLLDIAGIGYQKMSEVLILVESEGIIDLEEWIDFRNIRNELEHDYPEELAEALMDLKYCVDSFVKMQKIVEKVFDFVRRYDAAL